MPIVSMLAASVLFAAQIAATAPEVDDRTASETRAENVQIAEAENEGSWVPTSATRVVCRQMPARVGSRIGTRRICATAQQWDRWRRENRDVVERAQRFGLRSN